MHQTRLLERYKLRLSRKRLLWRGFKKRSEIEPVHIDVRGIRSASFILCATVRNEAFRLPYFLEHYRRLGVQHFLIVSNDSTDETLDLLAEQPDVSVWHTAAGYKAARFGVDWLTWLQRKHCHGKWTLTVDADELLIYPDWDRKTLPDLTAWLDARRVRSFGAMLLDLYPKGSPDTLTYTPGQDPTKVLSWFDPSGYMSERRGRHRAVCVVGGVRARCFFADAPYQAPVLSKTPLIKWHRSYVYFSSMHVVLPAHLNAQHTADWHTRPTGILLHTKFLPGIGARAQEDKARGQQYTRVPEHDSYYDKLADAPDLWSDDSVRYTGWQSVMQAGLMWRGDW